MYPHHPWGPLVDPSYISKTLPLACIGEGRLPPKAVLWMPLSSFISLHISVWT